MYLQQNIILYGKQEECEEVITLLKINPILNGKQLICSCINEQEDLQMRLVDGNRDLVIILAGLTAFDAPLPIILNFEQYRNEPIMVTKMREACHYNLYALANSAAMNGIGENTTVDVVEYFMIPLFRWLAIGVAFFSIFATVKWYDGNKKWKEYKKC